MNNTTSNAEQTAVDRSIPTPPSRRPLFGLSLVRGSVIAVWLALLVYVALLPRVPRIPGVPESYLSIGAHLAAHAVLAALIYWWLTEASTRVRRRFAVAAAALAVSSGTGLALELLQLVSGGSRSFQLTDVLVDVMGSALGGLVVVNAENLRLPRQILTGLVLATAGLLATGAVAAAAVWNPAYPYRGDHWHAQLLIQVCGEVLPPFEAFLGGIHSHGDRLIHIHPHSPDDEGANATLGRFFENAGGQLTKDRLTLPSGDSFSSGESCNGGAPATLRAFLYDPKTGERLSEIEAETHVLKDIETVLIEFLAD